MVIATLTHTLRDLGTPAILGTIVGVVGAAWAAKRRGDKDHERTLELVVMQDARRTALETCRRVRAMETEMRSRTATDYGELHNEWQDFVFGPALLIRAPDLESRVKAWGIVIFNAWQAPEEYASYAVLRGAEDVAEWLQAFLRRETPPAPHLPSPDEVRRLLFADNKITFQPLNDLLGQRPGAV